MPEPFIGELQVFGFNFAPRDWALCNGQLLPISQNMPLFSLIGTYYGGDGRETVGLPNLQGQVATHWGGGPGLSNYTIGERTGQKTVPLSLEQIPSHKHQAHGGDGDANSTIAASNVPGTTENPAYSVDENAPMSRNMIGKSGGGQEHNNMQPYLVNNWCICLNGAYPERS